MNKHTGERGSALIQVFVVGVVLLPLLAVLTQFTIQRSNTADLLKEDDTLRYGAESGLVRMKALLTTKCGTGTWLSDNYTYADEPENWIAYQPEEKAEFVTDGAGWWRLNGSPDQPQIRCRFIKLEDDKSDAASWYQLIAQCKYNGRYAEARCLCTLEDTFAKYARFVAGGFLDIRDNAEYRGEVYASGNLLLNGTGIVFHEAATTSGVVTNKPNATFHKGYSENVDNIALPGQQDIEAVKSTLTDDDLLIDYRDSNYREYFRSKTGVYPADPVHVYITFKGDEMDITVQSTTVYGVKGYTETGVDINPNSVVWVKGYTHIKGDLSARLTIYTQKRDGGNGGCTYVRGPVRYVDEWGYPKYRVLASDGYDAPYNDTTRTWQYNAPWNVPTTANPDPAYPRYVENTEFRTPDDGEPCLAVVCAKAVYIDCDKLDSSYAQKNLECHGVYYSAESNIQARNFALKGYNLIFNGSVLTQSANDVSNGFYFRRYLYDPALAHNPPPKFPAMKNPKFSCVEYGPIGVPAGE